LKQGRSELSSIPPTSRQDPAELAHLLFKPSVELPDALKRPAIAGPKPAQSWEFEGKVCSRMVAVNTRRRIWREKHFRRVRLK